MDINALLNLIGNYTVLLIPLVLGLTEVIKRMLPETVTTKWTPVISLVLSLVAAILFIGFTRQAAVAGLVIGLSASGLWSGGKTILGQGTEGQGSGVRGQGLGNKGFIRPTELALLLIGSLLLASLVGCAGDNIKPSSSVATYEAIGGSVTVVRTTEKQLCAEKTIKPADCAKFDAVYKKARAAFITAGNLLIVAINAGDAQSWADYSAAMVAATKLIPEVVSLAAELGILKGGGQ